MTVSITDKPPSITKEVEERSTSIFLMETLIKVIPKKELDI